MNSLHDTKDLDTESCIQVISFQFVICTVWYWIILFFCISGACKVFMDY